MNTIKKTPHLGVLLWDLDETLVRVKRQDQLSPHKKVLNNRGILINNSEIQFSGRTDFEILSELTKGPKGYIDQKIFLSAFKDLDKESARQDQVSTFSLLPGALELLKDLAFRGWKHGVLTGNTQARLNAKIKKSGIADFFLNEYLFGCQFGDSRQSIARRAKIYLSQKNQTDAFIIGDTPFDIAAARSSNFPVISVASGIFSVEELSVHNPDLLLRDLSEDGDVLIQFLSDKMKV